MEIVKNKTRWSVYASKCVKYYNISNDNIYDKPEQYTSIDLRYEWFKN